MCKFKANAELHCIIILWVCVKGSKWDGQRPSPNMTLPVQRVNSANFDSPPPLLPNTHIMLTTHASVTVWVTRFASNFLALSCKAVGLNPYVGRIEDCPDVT